MRLTTFSDYTLRVLMYLAIDPSKLATIPIIANAYGISENHLMKVVHQLVRATPIVECQEEQTSSYCIVPACQLSKILTRAFDTLYATLDEYTLADLMGKRRVLTRILIAPTNSGSSP